MQEQDLATEVRDRLTAINTLAVERLDSIDKKLVGVDSELLKMKGLHGMRVAGGDGRPETFGELVAKSADVKAFMGSAMRGGVKIPVAGRLRQKNITTLTDVAAPALMLPIEQLPQQRLTVLDLIPSIQFSGGTLKFNRQLAPRPTADYQLVEGDLKKEGDFVYELIELAVSTIAIWTQASKQAISSVQGLQLFLETELLYAVKLKEEQEVLNGVGGAGKIEGINKLATIVPPTAGEGFLDAAARAIAHLTAQGIQPTGLVVNPGDLLGAALVKTTQGEYILGSPTQGPPTNLWGVPLVQSVAQPTGQITAGDFSRGALLAYSDTANVEMSTEDRDNFVRNLVTVRAEEGLILAIKAPAKFAKIVLIP